MKIFTFLSFFLLIITLLTGCPSDDPFPSPSPIPIRRGRCGRFGSSVSTSGDYAIVGAPMGGVTGAAYIFLRQDTTWVRKQRLFPGDEEEACRFGDSVSISGDYALVGAHYDSNNTGAAYIFTRQGSTWIEQQKLTASDGSEYDRFGSSVSISGDYALIGAYRYDDNGERFGSAYIFIRDGTTWTEQQKLTASDGMKGDNFGCSVSISGDYALVASSYADDNGDLSGSAYIFTRDGTTWTEQKLTASDVTAYDNFGKSVCIYGDYAIIGAPGDDGGSGSAYIFVREEDIWNEQAKLAAGDGNDGDWFGLSVNIFGDHAIVGCGYDTPAAYIFARDGTTWTEQQKLIASEPGDFFGFSASISGDYAIVGAPFDSSGSAYVFVMDDTTWTEHQKLFCW